MTHYWTCRKCRTRHPRRKQVCPCGARRPKRRAPRHLVALELPYEEWVARFGNKCGICGTPASNVRRLDRDHDHVTGEPRGLLCHRCNRALPNWITTDWLLKAVRYLQRD